jgi:nucleoside-triphosphatase
MSASGNILLITGTPGIGKTTAIRKFISTISGLTVSGFYTEEIRTSNVRQGFELVTLLEQRFIMAHVDSNSEYRVGKYGVDVAAIDKAVALTLPDANGTDLYVVDEIGKMECFSDLFIKRMSALLDSGKTVVATVALKGGGFITKVKNRPGIVVWEITRKNRNNMPDRIAAWVWEKQELKHSTPVYTVGHSNLDVATFLKLLKGNAIQVVVDVRSAPFSRYVPQFNKREIEATINDAGMKYIFMGDTIGGKPADSICLNADGSVMYDKLALTETFQQGLDRLARGQAEGWTVALMCAEEDPFKCHRHHLIAKELELQRHIPVWHIRSDGTIMRAKELLENSSAQLKLF